ncbi:serpin family protein [Streptomyces sp. NPDC048637]|uniref:serpin family protein n=1 Tax=Streptomyces sp. NPDC048637 TaxID=3155636 RepID=UPI0034294CF3
MVAAATARAVNDMTARWARETVGERNSVLTAAGVWPLLALLAGPAAGPARQELAEALGTDARHAVREGRELLAALAAADGVDAAVGLWARRTLTLHPEWLGSLPPAAHGELTADPAADQEAMDSWARRHTDGLIEQMPVQVTPDLLLVLASALLVRTTWVEPFQAFPGGAFEGPWAGRELMALSRSGPDVDGVAVHGTPAGPLTAVRVEGDNGLDVHLLLGGPEVPGGEVLRHGVAALDGAYRAVSGAALSEGADGPGLTVTTVPSYDGVPCFNLTATQFTVDADHDLLKHAALFGLATATDTSRGHFPGISDQPLAVSAARQTATATFGPLGFRAAAVTVMPVAAGSVPPPPPYRAQQISARFDRPFGFLAVHRASGLVLVAGWVATP